MRGGSPARARMCLHGKDGSTEFGAREGKRRRRRGSRMVRPWREDGVRGGPRGERAATRESHGVDRLHAHLLPFRHVQRSAPRDRGPDRRGHRRPPDGFERDRGGELCARRRPVRYHHDRRRVRRPARLDQEGRRDARGRDRDRSRDLDRQDDHDHPDARARVLPRARNHAGRELRQGAIPDADRRTEAFLAEL